jgi:hypothetical protein
LLNTGEQPVELPVEKPQTNFYVTLLIENSARMDKLMAGVHQAANSGLDQAPANAYFTVIQFNEDDQALINFTNDHTSLKNVIDSVKVLPYPYTTTCLYNTVYDTVELLDRIIQNPQERRAIILVSRGKNEPAERCNGYTYEQLLEKARPLQTPGTPIYTLGPCAEPTCNNLDVPELTKMAFDTSASTATGQEAKLSEAFRQVMVNLGAQQMVRANLLAGPGENQATLSVKLRGVETPLSTTFSFFSDRNYIPEPAPAPEISYQPPRLTINALRYTEPENIYTLSLSLANPQSVTWLAAVVDDEEGKQVFEAVIPANNRPTVEVQLNAVAFKAGRRHIITVQALDEYRNIIELEDGDDLIPVQVTKEFIHSLTEPAPLEFEIESTKVDYETGRLMIDLNIITQPAEVLYESFTVGDAGQPSNPELLYEGFIIDDTGQRIHDFEPRLINTKRLNEPLPEAIRQAAGGHKYTLFVYLSTAGGRVGPQAYEFEATPPPAPGFLQSVWETAGRPGVLIPIGIIALGLAGWWLVSAGGQNIGPQRPPYGLSATDEEI